jgi:hypothetical protein
MKCPNPDCNEMNHEEGAQFCHVCGWSLNDSTKEEIVISDKVNETGKPDVGIGEPPIKRDMSMWKYLIGFSAIIAATTLGLMFNSMSTKESNDKELPQKQVMTDYPKELSGNYFARKIDGVTNANATIKIYREGDGYGLNVYSSNITRKYIFTYNPSTGEIVSDELGSGNARIKELTNETEITFTGWELLK